MELGWLIGLYVIAAAGWITALIVSHTSRKHIASTENKRSVTVTQPALVSDKKHGLKYLERGGSSGANWFWTCECGRRGTLSTFDALKPTEERAILDWRKHVETHERLILPTNELSHQACDARFVGLWSLFDKYRTACYCQQTSDELILLNQEAKNFEKIPEKGVQLES